MTEDPGREMPPTEEAVVAVAMSRLGHLRIVKRLAKGHGSCGWLVERAGGERLLVKLAMWDDRIDNVHCALVMAAERGVPAPRLIDVFRDEDSLHGRVLSVLTWIDGLDWTDIVSASGAAEKRRLCAQLGEILAKLHFPPVRCFADSAAPSGRTYQTWSDLVGHRLSVLGDRYTRDGVPLSSLVGEARDALYGLVEELSAAPIVPSLTHRDIYGDNIIISSGSIAGIIDFEQAKLWDGVAEFAKIEMLLFDRDPDALDVVLRQYENAVGGVSALHDRLRLAVGLELVWGLPYFYRHEQPAMAARWESSIANWLAAT